MMNLPNPDQLEALALLIEDCAEVIHQAVKIVRHGVGESTDPNTGVTYDNNALLAEELAQLSVSTELVILLLELDTAAMIAYRQQRVKKLQQYLHRAVNAGIVEALGNADTARR